MGLQRLLMKRRFCLHTRATRRCQTIVTVGALLMPTCRTTRHLLPDCLPCLYKSLRKGGDGAASFWQDDVSPLQIGRAHAPQGYYSAGRSQLAADFCLDVQPALIGHCGFSPWGTNLVHILLRHTSIPPPSRAARHPS